jgi:arylformamidase
LLRYKKIIDITPQISARLAVFPGDVEFSRAESMSTRKGQHITLSAITSTLHIGAHADSESHYHKDGAGIEARALAPYLGPCQVIRVKLTRGARIKPEHIKRVKIIAKRVLFATDSFPNPEKWNGDFNSLSPELIDYLVKKKVELIGIDTPSVDPADSKGLESHQAIYRARLAILEGIVLTDVKAGRYDLVALPLPIVDGDASPVRAVLLK